MNCKLEFLELKEDERIVSALTFNKSELKSELGLELLKRQIQAMCHLYCFTTEMTKDDILEEIKNIRGKEVTFTIIVGKVGENHKTIFLSKTKKNRYFYQFE